MPSYEIHVRGHLDRHWEQLFLGLAMRHGIADDGTPVTVLRGAVVDEAALHGLLTRVRDLGVPLLLVRRVARGAAEAGPSVAHGEELGEPNAWEPGGPEQ